MFWLEHAVIGLLCSVYVVYTAEYVGLTESDDIWMFIISPHCSLRCWLLYLLLDQLVCGA